MPQGRPSSYSPEIASEILAEIATTRKGLKAICKEREDFPSPSTVYLWLLHSEDFSEKYARAKQDSLQVLEDEILDISDNQQPGEIVTIKGDGSKEVKISDMLEHRKLQIESRKWLMMKLKPKKYGDRITQELTDADGGAPTLNVVIRSVLDPK